jgi:hypothetical protein
MNRVVQQNNNNNNISNNVETETPLWKRFLATLFIVAVSVGLIAVSLVFCGPIAPILVGIIAVVALTLLALVWVKEQIIVLIDQLVIIIGTLCAAWLLGLFLGPIGALFAVFFGALLFYKLNPFLALAIAGGAVAAVTQLMSLEMKW